MALYLGNQKVSLRSGQDPTFDYGFDSNGRLVFANKNATEINNFLNYDSAYSEILNLSNLSKMEKVAVNGTADRKMEGLKGLLVSPNAPFTGSSPQINASYTGLNKSALVSLFESVPYNVGYEKVGSPTINDGVVSGFSDSDYLRLASVPNFANDFEIGITFTLNNTSNCTIIGNDNYYYQGIVLYSTNAPSFTLNGTNYSVSVSLPKNTIQLGHTYHIVVKREGNSLSISAFENNQMIASNQASIGDDFLYRTIYTYQIGKGPDGIFNGSIDLNQTYIKVNGVPWFGPGATKNLVPDGTVVGNVSVKDGVASGFSADDYIKTSSSIDVNYNIVNGFDIQTRIKIPSYNSGLAIHYFTGSGGISSGLAINNAGKVYWLIGRDDTSGTNIGIGSGNTTTIPLDTYYYIRLKISNKIATLYTSIDGALWNTESTLDMTEMVIKTYYNRPFGFGHAGTSNNNNYIFNGSIDLNNTYIKVGSDYFYRGMVPMTKTCSVVGATGTADLTQEDKNIILNKGWSLTVQ